jgi:regulator of extracellular matrix RemA (YlzA/DUF370 family)
MPHWNSERAANERTISSCRAAAAARIPERGSAPVAADLRVAEDAQERRHVSDVSQRRRSRAVVIVGRRSAPGSMRRKLA